MLIVFEGIDGCGKGTQIRMLRERMDFELVEFPTAGFKVLREHLDKKTELAPKALVLTFLADIANEAPRVKRLLDSGKNVVLDRYVFSTIAYAAEGVQHETVRKLVSDLGYLKPDKVLLLDIPPEEAQKRKTKQKQLDRYEEDVKFLSGVRSEFLKLAKDKFLTGSWQVIDASLPVSEVHAIVAKTLL
ncbi:MAG: dTMP kinase [Candidatus Bilamarchaeaceae archaeon]